MRSQLKEMQLKHNTIVIDVASGKKQYLYYKDSKLFTELQSVLNDIIESFISEIVLNSASVPVILTNQTKTKVLAFGNLDSLKMTDSLFIKTTLNEMSFQKEPIKLNLAEGKINYIFYKDSKLLTQIKFYPYIQFGIIALFLIIAYSLFSNARRAEQNQVWVGMSKETAHQLGTPLSSLMAWLELLRLKQIDPDLIGEMEKDVSRLNTITDRFSKIGSAPQLELHNVFEVMENAISYLEKRVSNKVKFTYNFDRVPVNVPLNVPLFQWVIENLVKNAVDAMSGIGELKVDIIQEPELVYIDITDNGKGIPKSKHKTVFQPGYTTKQRGWGLGLSLAKRIIEEYHGGKIFVKWSEPRMGTTFRIILEA
jgi:signal transduction histidine kinase